MPTKSGEVDRKVTGLWWIHRLTVFIACVPVAIATAGAEDTNNREQEEMNTITLFYFDSPSELWRNVDDSVMGGVSSSRMRIEDGIAIFEGELSLDNNGGFASVRSNTVQPNLAGYDGIRLRVKGDGKSYRLRIRTSPAFDGPSYQLTFETTRNEWLTIKLHFADFTAAFRGKQIPNHPPVDTSKIATVGLLIADKQAGAFRLDVESIKAYRDAPSAHRKNLESDES